MVLRRLCYIALPLGVIVVLLFLAERSPHYQAANIQSVPDHLIKVDCDLSIKDCPIRLGDLSMTLSLNPTGLPALTPLQLSISKPSPSIEEARSWSVWFVGRDMDMGRHLMTPAPIEGAEQGGHSGSGINSMQYTGMIPVCTVDRSMMWLLNVQFAWRSELYRFVLPASGARH
jgi:hypothetical protein